MLSEMNIFQVEIAMWLKQDGELFQSTHRVGRRHNFELETAMFLHDEK